MREEDQDEVTDTLSTATFAGHNTQHLTRLAMERPTEQNRTEQQRHRMNTQIQIQIQVQVCVCVGAGAVSEQEVLLQVQVGETQVQVNVQVFCGSPRRDGPTNLSCLRRVYINSNWPITVCSIVFVACGG